MLATWSPYKCLRMAAGCFQGNLALPAELCQAGEVAVPRGLGIRRGRGTCSPSAPVFVPSIKSQLHAALMDRLGWVYWEGGREERIPGCDIIGISEG